VNLCERCGKLIKQRRCPRCGRLSLMPTEKPLNQDYKFICLSCDYHGDGRPLGP
jgi:hypothetical protein